VRADLQHRRLAVASGQRRQIRFRHDDGNLDRGPGEALEPKTESDFLRIGRDVVMVQDDVGHERILLRIITVSSAGALSAPRKLERNADTARATASGCSNSRKCPARGRSTTRTRSPDCSRSAWPFPGGAASSSSPWITRRGAVPALHQYSRG